MSSIHYMLHTNNHRQVATEVVRLAEGVLAVVGETPPLLDVGPEHRPGADLSAHRIISSYVQPRGDFLHWASRIEGSTQNIELVIRTEGSKRLELVGVNAAALPRRALDVIYHRLAFLGAGRTKTYPSFLLLFFCLSEF